MDVSNILPVIIIIVLALVGCIFCYKIGYDHGNRPFSLLFMSFEKKSTYEVLAFSVGHNGEHTMFLKNSDRYAAYPLAAVSGKDLAYIWKIGDTIITDEAKGLHLKKNDLREPSKTKA